ncbi:MAG: DMT family transporter [Gammaproteobacteria bacterium]|nr:DMT family transporter [Gammaproteobacteria bacterium]NIR85094.1 DMT family transporter [Gammaproteobacteria bacterium]NIR92004.1 DMT family transporter [Gammaproteobacteria bacterium]NIU06143.1 DMT family transporter [Gammaproteobacteria bacterium]NIV53086.1 EamA-like transporter family protein [Gammaproteobacteria bacterium]
MSPALLLLLVPIAILVGCLQPTQAGINATLARHYPHPLFAALTNTLVASLAVLAAMLVLRVRAPDMRDLAAAPWWSWLGGVLGGTSVVSAILLAPRLGAAPYVSALLVGTVAASLVLDHFGLIGFREHPVNAWRLLGGALVVTGMLLVQTH